jgi:hypothetical protein
LSISRDALSHRAGSIDSGSSPKGFNVSEMKKIAANQSRVFKGQRSAVECAGPGSAFYLSQLAGVKKMPRKLPPADDNHEAEAEEIQL